MSIIHINSIQAALEKLFSGKIDMSDVSDKGEEFHKSFLSRSLAAFAIMHLTGIESDEAAKTITDGPNDDGIDAIFHDPTEEVLYLVQSKWDKNGKKTIEAGDALKFVEGFRHLINGNFNHGNEKIKILEPIIGRAIRNAKEKFKLVVVYSGADQMNQVHVQPIFESLLEEMNDVSEVLQLEVINQSKLHEAVSSLASGTPINLPEIVLSNFGRIESPDLCYYGLVDVMDIGKWWKQFGTQLFHKNLRKFVGKTEVNDQIKVTLSKSPESFFYFNNGITMLATSLIKKPIGGASRETGIFECSGVSIVNGAQTVGSIGEAIALGSEFSDVKVLVRIISLEKGSIDFANLVTRATNTQNKIEPRDFVSLDPEQHRLKSELWAVGQNYLIKSGDALVLGEDGFDITEATVALACRHNDLTFTIQAKRELGKFWEDISKGLYKALFNQSVSAASLKSAVEIFRLVDAALKKVEKSSVGRRKAVSIHGNRLILHLVFQESNSYSSPSPTNFVDKINSKVEELVDRLDANISKQYANSQLHSLFKNKSKCKDISAVSPQSLI